MLGEKGALGTLVQRHSISTCAMLCLFSKRCNQASNHSELDSARSIICSQTVVTSDALGVRSTLSGLLDNSSSWSIS